MTSSHSRSRRAKKRAVLIVGEDPNDTDALKELILALCPSISVEIRTRRDPQILMKGARSDQIASRAQKMADLIAAESVDADIVCIFMHEDADAVSPAEETLSEQIETAMLTLGHNVHAVTPAWELEAWWFLWPSALKRFRPSWRELTSYVGRDVGKIRNAKEELRRALRPQGSGHRTRDYRESDSPRIAATVRSMGLVSAPEARSDSFIRFSERVRDCCVRASLT